jgi:hypothetical protein
MFNTPDLTKFDAHSDHKTAMIEAEFLVCLPHQQNFINRRIQSVRYALQNFMSTTIHNFWKGIMHLQFCIPSGYYQALYYQRKFDLR